MNFLFLSELFYPHGGGAELATYLYAKLLSKENNKVIVVTNRFSGETRTSEINGFIVHRLPLIKYGSMKFSMLARPDVLLSTVMRKLIKTSDVIYIPRYWFSAIPIAKIYGKPVITHLHDYIPICPLATFYNSSRNEICKIKGLCSERCIYIKERKKRGAIETAVSMLLNLNAKYLIQRFIGESDAIICVSSKHREILIENLPKIANRTEVISNPQPNLTSIEMSEDGFGYFGGPNVMKGIRILRKALRLIQDDSLKVHATGFSSEHDNIQLNKLGLVTYPRLDEKEFSGLYEKIRCVLVPSIWHEPAPYVIGESLLRGRVVIASRIGGIPELVEGCKGSFLFPPGDFHQLSEKMIYVAGLSREDIFELGCQNREVFKKKYSNEKTVQDFLEICHKVSSIQE